jgi:hypothetical protein
MTEEKDVNIEIATFIGPDPYTLRNMGQICPAFEQDVAGLLEKAIVHVKKMRVMEEFLEFVHSRAPVISVDLYVKMFTPGLLTTFEHEKIQCIRMKYQLWAILNMNVYG